MPTRDLTEARSRLAIAQAEEQERKNRQLDGETIEMEVAERIFFDTARAARDAWMNWPARVAPLLAAELGVVSDKMLAALNESVHQQLVEMGEPEDGALRDG